MKWNKASLEQYVQAKEYVDTLVIPLSPFHLSQDSDLKKSAFQSELLSIFSNEIEKELTGRIMLTPSFNYLKKSNKETEANRLNEWLDDAKTQPFNHIFLVTFDAAWKKNEEALNGHLLWLPGITSEDLHSKKIHALMQAEERRVGKLIQSYW